MVKKSRKTARPPKKEQFSKRDSEIEIGVLLTFILIVILVRHAQPWGNILSHTYPTFYNANDNFFNGYVTPEYVKRVGNFKHMPPHIVLGYEDVVGYYPVMLSHISAIFSIASGIETYDSSSVVVMILSIATMILMYFVIKVTNKHLALISLPFMLGVYHFSFEVAHAFGLYLFLMGGLFMVGVIWCATRLKENFIFLPIALFLTSNVLGHFPEMLFSLGFLILVIFIDSFKTRQIDEKKVKNLAFAVLVFLFLSFYYLSIFKSTWMVSHPFKFEVMDEPPFAPAWGVHLDNFGITSWLLYAGIFLTILLFGLYEADRKKHFGDIDIRQDSIALVGSLYLLLMGFGNYFGLERRAWQTRILWPIYLSPLFGFAVYFFYMKIVKKLKFKHVAVLSVSLLAIFAQMHTNELQGGIIDDGTWDAMRWIDTNTPQDSRIYYFYVPLISQPFSLWSSNRLEYRIEINDFIEGIEKGVIKPYYTSVSDSEPSGLYAYKKSLSPFDFGYHAEEAGHNERTVIKGKEMWEMDYYIFTIDPDKGHPMLVQYNLAIIDLLLKTGSMNEVYNNQVISILENMHLGVSPITGE